MVEPVERPTLRQVAELAGVSLKTVSRVVNNEPHVSPATVSAVHAAATELGFRVNNLARELRAGAASSTVGLLVGDLANPYWSGLARGVEREISAMGLRLLSASTDENPDLELALAQDMLDRRVRALLVVTSSTNHDFLLAELRRNVAVTFLDRPPGDLEADTIVIDNLGGARAAVRHLYEHGHRSIAVVGDSETFYTHRERRRGYEEEMRELGLPIPASLVWPGASGPYEAEMIVGSALAAPDPPTAIFALNNWVTAGALRAFGRMPETRRPALVGFDDIDFGDLLGVTVIAHDAEEMGRSGAQAAIARLDGDRSPAKHVVLETRLIPRGSGERRPG